MSKNVLRMLALACMCGGIAVANADDLKNVKKKIVDAFQQHKSLSADLVMDIDAKMMGQSVKGSGEGKLLAARKDGKWMTRLNMTQSIEMGPGQKMESEVVSVTNDKFKWTYTKQMGQEMVRKEKVTEESGDFTPASLLEQMEKEMKLEYAGEEQVDGDTAYVIKAEPKEPNPMMQGAGGTKLYFSKKHGVVLKQVTLGPENEPMQTMTYKNYKFDEKLDMDKFTYEPPEGVTVQDMTGA